MSAANTETERGFGSERVPGSAGGNRASMLGLDASYLQDVVGDGDGNSGDDFLEGPSTSLLSAETSESLLHRELQTPAKEGADSTKEIPQLLSPFSPLLRPQNQSLKHSNLSSTYSKAENEQQESVSWAPPDSFCDRDISLFPCRKISVVIHVSYRSNSGNFSEANDQDFSTKSEDFTSQPVSNSPRLCLFPLLHENVNTDKNNKAPKPTLSPTSATLQASTNARDLVLVNPKSFGKFIPSEITMETARLVAQVANIESEDWARTYRFQHVIWPDQELRSFSHLANALANDVLSGKHKSMYKKGPLGQENLSRIIIGTGSSYEKMQKMFGSRGGKYDAVKNDEFSKTQLLEHYGLIGLTFDTLFRHLPDFAVCALSISEILQEDDIRDLLATHSGTSRVQIRQSKDGRGAEVQGLTEYPVDSLESLRDCLQPILLHDPERAIGTSNRGTQPYHGGHVVVFLKIWQSAVQHDLDLQTKCATLTFVHLSSLTQSNHQRDSGTDIAKHNFASSPSSASQSTEGRLPWPFQRPSTKQSTFLQTSISSLGGVLRGISLREAGSDAIILYRTSTLTKVLQRSLDHPDCRVVVLASLSPLSDAYDATLATLRYVERLLVRSGLPKSPFEKQQVTSQKHSSPQSTPSSPSSSVLPSVPPQPQFLMEQFAGKESILESVVTDPRQRLARFYRSQQQLSPTDSFEAHGGNQWEGMDDHNVPQTNYLQSDPADLHPENEGLSEETKILPEISDDNHSRPTKSLSEGTYSSPLARYVLPPLSPNKKPAKEENHPSTDLGGTAQFNNYHAQSTSSFSHEISILESSVNAMKNAHFDIWRSSTFSIRQLKELFMNQQQMLDDLIAENSDAVERTRSSDEQCARLSQQMDALRKQKDEEISTLNETVDKARADRADVEKIAEEAIAAQDSLEQTVAELEHKLLAHRDSSQTAQEELQRLSKSEASLSKELHEVKGQLSSEKNLHSRETAELQAVISRLEADRKKESKEKSDRESSLLRQLDQQDQSLKVCKQELESSRLEFSTLQQQQSLTTNENDQEAAELRQRIFRFKSAMENCEYERNEAFAQRDQYLEKFKDVSLELEKTRNDLSHRLLDLEELSSSLQQALEDREEMSNDIGHKEKALASFQSETRRKVERVAQFRDYAAALVEQTVQENRILVNTNKRLRDALARTKEERDALMEYRRNNELQGHRSGQDRVAGDRGKLQESLQNDSMNHNHSQRGSSYEERRGQKQSSQLDVTPYSHLSFDVKDSNDLSRRAEEIAACLALSARKKSVGRGSSEAAPISVYWRECRGFPENNDDGLLAVSTLKRKIKLLEKALLFGEESLRRQSPSRS